jgi:hypothetical protein
VRRRDPVMHLVLFSRLGKDTVLIVGSVISDAR